MAEIYKDLDKRATHAELNGLRSFQGTLKEEQAPPHAADAAACCAEFNFGSISIGPALPDVQRLYRATIKHTVVHMMAMAVGLRALWVQTNEWLPIPQPSLNSAHAQRHNSLRRAAGR